MLSLYFYKLMGKIKEHEEKNYLMIDDYMVDKVLDKIKEIVGIEKIDDTKILINTEDNVSNQITSKNVAILLTCATKDDNKFLSIAIFRSCII